MLRRSNPASDSGFSLHHFPALDAAVTRLTTPKKQTGFSVRNFSQSASGKNTAGVGRGTLMSAGVF